MRMKKSIYLLKQQNHELMLLKSKGDHNKAKYLNEALCARADMKKFQVQKASFKHHVQDADEKYKQAYEKKKEFFVNFQAAKSELVKDVAKLLNDIRLAEIKKERVEQEVETV